MEKRISTSVFTRKHYLAWAFSLSKQNELTTIMAMTLTTKQAYHLDPLKDYIFVWKRALEGFCSTSGIKLRPMVCFLDLGIIKANF